MIGKRGKQALLDRLYNPKCKKCKLRKSSVNVCILGKGNVMSKIMLIGEAPGSAESKSGKPFMGRSGKLLDECIEKAGLKNKVYITNTVRCRPPSNRNPENSELSACRYYLQSEISIIEPESIVLMGSVATKAFGIDKKRIHSLPIYIDMGAPLKWRGYLNKSWHPAYCLRTGKQQIKQLINTLRWAKK